MCVCVCLCMCVCLCVYVWLFVFVCVIIKKNIYIIFGNGDVILFTQTCIYIIEIFTGLVGWVLWYINTSRLFNAKTMKWL